MFVADVYLGTPNNALLKMSVNWCMTRELHLKAAIRVVTKLEEYERKS